MLVLPARKGVVLATLRATLSLAHALARPALPAAVSGAAMRGACSAVGLVAPSAVSGSEACAAVGDANVPADLDPCAVGTTSVPAGSSLAPRPSQGAAGGTANRRPLMSGARACVREVMQAARGSSGAEPTSAPPTFRTTLSLGAAMLPHPGKRNGGEDALFESHKARAFGVADGVGGWVLADVDAGLISRSLMEECKGVVERDMARDDEDGPLSPLEILKTAHARIPHGTLGTTTAILGTLRGDDTFRAAWIGDSGMLVIRTTAGDPQVIYRSAEQQHSFNYPFQLGAPGGSPSDDPDSAEEVILSVVDGDLIIMASDGLFDNLFDEEIVEIVDNGGEQPHEHSTPGAAASGHRGSGARSGPGSGAGAAAGTYGSSIDARGYGSGPVSKFVASTWSASKLHHGDLLGDLDLDKLARRLAERAQERATTTEEIGGEIVPTPFEVSARSKGIEMMGGKLDDVAIVIARVSRITQ